MPAPRRRERSKPAERSRPVELKPPDCCAMRIAVIAGSDAVITAIGNEVNLNEDLAVNARVDETVNAVANANEIVQDQAISHVETAAVGTPGPAASAKSDSAADAKAAGQSQSGADAKNIGNSDSRVQLRQTKPKDLFAKKDTYRVQYRVIGCDHDALVRVVFAGEVNAEFHCGPREADFAVSRVKVLESARPLPRGATRIDLNAVGSCGDRANCQVVVPEP